MRTDPTRAYRAAVVAVLAVQAGLLLANAWRYDWLRGYDAFANDRYAEILADEHRLPSVEESGVWHTPPLWFAVVGVLRRGADAAGWEQVQRPGQLVAAAAGLAVCLLTFLLARALWPERRVLHVAALLLTAMTPALVRASAMYHPETLAVALGAAGLLVAVRALRRGPSVGSALGAGALLGLASLTRAWALPVLVAVVVAFGLDALQRRRAAPALVTLAVALAVLAPWLANQQLVHGDAFAFNRDAPPQSLLDRRPASFYLGPHTLRAFEHPITPLARNELVPHLYADWWGDWALTWDSPPPPPPAELLPPSVVARRAQQMVVGLVPTVLALGGLIALGVLAGARRSPALAVLPLAALGVALAYVLFAVRFPSTDGDTIKGTYLLMALPAAGVGAAFVLDTLRPRGRSWAVATLAVLAVLWAVELPFLAV